MAKVNFVKTFRVWNDEHTIWRELRIDDTGMQHDTTPICIHRCKKTFVGAYSIYRCEKHSDVVHCSGQSIHCNDYFNAINCVSHCKQLEINWN